MSGCLVLKYITKKQMFQLYKNKNMLALTSLPLSQNIVQLTYVWIGGNMELRSKSKIIIIVVIIIKNVFI